MIVVVRKFDMPIIFFNKFYFPAVLVMLKKGSKPAELLNDGRNYGSSTFSKNASKFHKDNTNILVRQTDPLTCFFGIRFNWFKTPVLCPHDQKCIQSMEILEPITSIVQRDSYNERIINV